MPHILLQIQPPPPGSIDPLAGWALFSLLTLLIAAVGKLYWDARNESKRKDQIIDRLLNAELRNANANRQSVSLLEEDRGRSR